METVFIYVDYRKYLLAYLKAQPKHGHGLRSRWAEAAGCQIAYVSHVLNGTNDFSLEQAQGISHEIGHTEEEAEYFLLLVQKARAGTPDLRAYFQKKIEQAQQQQNDLRNRMRIRENLKPDDQAIYYSKWHYAAIHMIVTIPELQTAQKIAEHFSISMAETRKYLEFLESRGLIQQNAGRYTVIGNFLHIGKDSPLFPNQQVTWRHKAVDAIYANRPEGLHFASCFSVAEKDLLKIREILSQAIEKSAEIIKPSKEEKLYSICLDFFEVR